MSHPHDDEELVHSEFDDAKRSIDSVERGTADTDAFALSTENLEADEVDDRPALEVDPGDAGPVQEDEDLPVPDERQGEGDDDE